MQITPLKTDTVIIGGRIRTVIFERVLNYDSTLSHDEGGNEIILHTWQEQCISQSENISSVVYGQSQAIAVSTMGTFLALPSWSINGLTVQVLPDHSIIKYSLPRTSILACKSSSVRGST